MLLLDDFSCWSGGRGSVKSPKLKSSQGCNEESDQNMGPCGGGNPAKAEQPRRHHEDQPRREADPFLPLSQVEEGCERHHCDDNAADSCTPGGGFNSREACQPRRYLEKKSQDRGEAVDRRVTGYISTGHCRSPFRLQTLICNISPNHATQTVCVSSRAISPT